MSEFYLTSRSSYQQDQYSPPTGFTRECDTESGSKHLWGFGKENYKDYIQSIEQKESIEIKGFLGYSFGSARLSYIEDRAFDWVVLVRPFPVGASGSELLTSRVEQTHELLEDNKVEPRPAAEDTSTPARGLEVTEFDYLSAELALAYLSESDIARHAPFIESRSSDALAARLSDSLWLRYGENSISPAYLAYLQEVCRASGPWAPEKRTEDPMAAVLESLHFPCSTYKDDPLSGLKLETSATKSCIVSSKKDPLVSERLLKRHMNFQPDATWVESPSNSHTAQDGTRTCLENTGVPAE